MLLVKNGLGQNLKIAVKSFECPEFGCNKVFSSSSNLTRHLIIHSGNSPFACDICSKRFNQKVNLLKHLKSHESDRLRRNHTSEVYPSRSFLCKRSFTAKLNRKRHLVTFHDKSQDCDDLSSQKTTAVDYVGDDDHEDVKQEKQGANLFSDGETTTQDALPHSTFLDSGKNVSLSFPSINSNISTEEDDYNLTFTSLKSFVPRNYSLRKPSDYRDFILSQFSSVNEEFQEMRYIIFRLLWVLEHPDSDRVLNHKECLKKAFTALIPVMEAGGEITSQKKAFKFDDLKMGDSDVRVDNQQSNKSIHTSLAPCFGGKMTAPDNDAFTKLARHFVSSPGYYDPDSMSLDTLSFEGVDAEDDEIIATRSETRNNRDVDLYRCRCCLFRGVDCISICKCVYDWFLLHGEWPTPVTRAKSALKS